MEPRYSASYIDQLVGERDSPGLHQLIAAVGRRSKLPDELWVFSRVLEWLGATRSGVWQYYESIEGEVFTRLKDWLLRTGWRGVHARYAQGMLDFSSGSDCGDLDDWLMAREHDLVDALWDLVTPQVGWLKVHAA